MKRLFWVAVGVTVGALVVKKLSDKARQMTPKGLAEQAKRQASGLGDAIRDFAHDVRAGIAERENELHEALLVDHHPNGHNGIDPDAASRLARDPDARWRESDD